MDTLQGFGKSVSNTFNTSFTPFAARTSQFVKEQLGQADDKTQLPADYRELEARVDALHKVHQRILSVTTQFGNEAYDYPPNLRESITDLSRNVTGRFQALSNAATPAEAQQALVSPTQAPTEPKTFAHAISRAAGASAELLPASDPLASGLEKLSTAYHEIGKARLAQDKVIVDQLVQPWTTNLNISFKNVAKHRQEVENARLLLDAAKARQRQREQGGGGPGLGSIFKKNPADEAAADQQLRDEVEHLEDNFINIMEKSVRSMNGLLNTPEPLRGLSALVHSVLEYHQTSADALQEIAESINGLQREQEASYRQSREDSS
ncbi:hypothetical protein TWF481_009679 [Arthrobotrys musiformis]|uniref:BAR domain-containing protein n=1 Tax=Arthrobotrys musiformis TaxID=47236 RepID=A0AAV9W4G7_9PEZI